MIRPGAKLDAIQADPDNLKETMQEIARLKPVRDALEDVLALREEMAVLAAHRQYALPDRVLKLTAKLDGIGRRILSEAV